MMQKTAFCVCAVLLAVAAAAGTAMNVDDADHRSTWLMFEITHAGEIHLKAAKKSQQPKGLCKGPPSTPDGHVLITYTDPETGKQCVVRSPDPRKMYHDHDAGNGKLAGGVMHHKKIEFAVRQY